MGLDMYLYANKHDYFSKFMGSKKNKVKYPKEITKYFNEFDTDTCEKIPGNELYLDRRSVSVDTNYEIGYWRKANAIHNWFVKNCGEGRDECQKIYVSLDKLNELRDTCEKVLQDKTKADELLPTISGFFFGSTQYDDDYFEDVKNTLDIVDKTIGFMKEAEKKKHYYDIIYQASW